MIGMIQREFTVFQSIGWLVSMKPYDAFIQQLEQLAREQPHLLSVTLSNIFTMRQIGTKTHGDLAEVAMTMFINQFLSGFSAEHVGKDLFRAKAQEEDIRVVNNTTGDTFFVSLKAYGAGPLQLSTDRDYQMFPALKDALGKQKQEQSIQGKTLESLWKTSTFEKFTARNILSLIYDERKQKCNVLVFDFERAKEEVKVIKLEGQEKRRKHSVFVFYDINNNYVCEVRYGDAKSNALQRGLWTHTIKAERYFRSITQGWIEYSKNEHLIELFSHALITNSEVHTSALISLKDNVSKLKETVKLKKLVDK